MMREVRSAFWLAAASLLTLAAARGAEARRVRADIPAVNVGDLPSEARDTIVRIRRGGPFPFRRDGVVFDNREHLLPARERGYYHEYTVPTPASRDRGARRIVTGGAGELYYSDDHYRSFRRVEGEAVP